jgi:hypothetical protein
MVGAFFHGKAWLPVKNAQAGVFRRGLAPYAASAMRHSQLQNFKQGEKRYEPERQLCNW